MDIQDLIKNLHLIEIRTRKKMLGGIASSYRNVFRGQGVEFSEVREYVEGDDVRLIDWNVSARFRSLYVKQLMEERELNVVVALQASRSMDFGTTTKTKFQMAAETASMLIFSAIHTGDRAGMVLFGGEKPLDYVPPKKGMHHGFRLLHRILERSVDGPPPDPDEVLGFLAHGMKRRSVVFLIGDFIYSDWNPLLVDVAARRHDLICINVLDPTEIEGPAGGTYRLIDENGRFYDVSVSRKTRKMFTESARTKREELEMIFRKSRIDFLPIFTDSAGELELHRLFLQRIRGA